MSGCCAVDPNQKSQPLRPCDTLVFRYDLRLLQAVGFFTRLSFSAYKNSLKVIASTFKVY